MKKRVVVRGIGRAPAPLLRAFEDCGVYIAAEGGDKSDYDYRTVAVYVADEQAELDRLASRMEGEGSGEPFVVYTSTEASGELKSSLAGAGLAGVITPETPPEDISFILNRAFFFAMASGRNRRVPVNIPVKVVDESRAIETVASMLSREGAFINTLNPAEAGSECEVTVKLPDGAPPLVTGARVLYSAGVNRDISIISNEAEPYRRVVSHPGMAVLFTGLTPGEAARIDSYIELVAGPAGADAADH